jgi:ABC-type transport system involved in multi-copper enzyme maturation permease subunit
MIGRLLFIEWLKARRRKTFWLVLLGAPIAVTLIQLPTYLIRQSRPEATPPIAILMPAGWPIILNLSAVVGGSFLAAALALLVASEGGWRTQRQNVIDGLSRTDYVAGKLLFGLAFVLSTWILILCTATILGLLNSGIDGVGWSPFAEPVHYLMMGGGLLYILMMATVGIFFGLLFGSSGLALGCAMLFMVAQTWIVIPILTVKGGVWLKLVPYLPAKVGESLRRAATYDAAQFAEMISSGRTVLLSAGAATLVALLDVALFAWGGWAAIRYRGL